MKHISVAFLTCVLTVGISSTLYAADTPLPDDYSQKFLGDKSGKRAALSKKGIDFDTVYTQDIWSNVSGGRKRGEVGLSSLDSKLAWDGEKMYGFQGSHALIHLLSTAGGRPDRLTGAWQGIDNIEVKQPPAQFEQEHTITLYEAWLEQEFLDKKASLKMGLYDLSSEFYVTETSHLFMGSTYRIGLEFAESGDNGPSSFPVTAPGLRAKFQPIENTYLQLALLDAVSGVPNHPKGIQFHLEPDDGALMVGELGYQSTQYGHYGVGMWHYTSSFPDLIDTDAEGNPLMRNNSQGAYFLAEKRLLTHVSGFFRIGVSSDDVNSGSYAWSAGTVYDTIIPSRQDSRLGFAVSSARNAEKWNQLVLSEGGQTDWNETIFELTYQDKPLPWLTIQPDVQYIVQPNASSETDNVFLLGTRFVVNF